MTMPNPAVLIMAGGTGGHVYPALAVAEELRLRGYNVSWLGTRKGIEARVVPAKNFPIHYITSVGVRGKSVQDMFLAPFMMFKGLCEALLVIRRVKPIAVLGMGGFVSVPGGIASWLLRKPLVIHEQNAVAGSANRLLSHLAARVLTGFYEVLTEGERIGNPVRKEIAELPLKILPFEIGEQRVMNVLVLGGSLGAKAINDVLPAVLKQFSATTRPQVWHQTGKTTYAATLALYQQQQLNIDGKQLRVCEFIDDMAAAYRWADLVVCRAGAITLAELACAGLPSILVPLPSAIDNHQHKNAEQFVDAAAAVLLPQQNLSAQSLFEQLGSLLGDRQRLRTMVHEARGLAEPRAAQAVADICLEAGENNG